MKNTGKYITTIILTLCVATSFAVDFNKNDTWTKEVNESWIQVDRPSSYDPADTKGNVVITVEEGVAVTATNTLRVWGTGSAMIFKGNNTVTAGQIILSEGAGETGATIEFHNSTVNVSGDVCINTGTSLVIDGGTFTASSLSQSGASSINTSGNIKIQNGADLILNGEGKSWAIQSHNIYIDASSTFTSTAQDAFYGTLTLEEGAEVSFAENTTTKFDNLTLIFDNGFVSNDILDMADFKGVTVGGETVVLSQLSENVIVQNNIGEQYEITFDETTGAYSVGNYVGSVPEPSTYAAIFGALALGFVIYRRRK